MSDLAVVTGAGGFIGGHLVADLLKTGHEVRAIDHRAPETWQQRLDGAESVELEPAAG